MHELQRLLGRPASAPNNVSGTFRKLQFYRMAVELEQLKEPVAKGWYKMPWQDREDGLFEMRYMGNEDFAKACVEDRKNKFPNDLCVGLFVKKEGKEFPLFQLVHPYADIQNDDPMNEECKITCPLSEFVVSPSVADDMELEEAQVDALGGCLQGVGITLTALREKMTELFNGEILIEETLQVALSSKNPSLLQLVSELKSLEKEFGLSGLIADFLENGSFANQLGTIDVDDLVPITAMDEAQREAVAIALGNKVSVVTGPPGCGKTQVILNLVANAILKGKSVLVASKNNKAVDNVRERLACMEGLEDSVVRFGSRSVRDTQTVPGLEELLNLAQRGEGKRESTAADLERAKNCHERACANLKTARALISRKNKLDDLLPVRERELSQAKENLTMVRESSDAQDAAYLSQNAQFRVFDSLAGEAIDCLTNAFRMKQNVFAGRYSGFGKFWIDWFTKRRHAAEVLGHVLGFPSDIRRFVEDRVGRRLAEEFKSGGEILTYYRDVGRALSDGEAYLRGYEDLKNRLAAAVVRAKDRVESAEGALEACRKELADITIRRPDEMLANAQKEIRENAAGYVAAALKMRLLGKGAAEAISSFKNYITGSLPWKREEVDRFADVVCSFLKASPVMAITSLSAKGALPLTSALVDMLVIDEASQCDVASALPLIFRAKQVVVIGDPKQLRHISKVKDEEEKLLKEHLKLRSVWTQYVAVSLWDRCRDWLTHARGYNKPVMLNGHYRCHPEIIGYSNRFFYSDMGGLVVRTGKFACPIREQGCYWEDVKGSQVSPQINVNVKEVNTVVGKAVELAKENETISIGIVTPFKAQAERMHHAIPKEFAGRITVSTVHKFQGDERDVMIYSLVVTDNSPASKINWIDNGAPNLVNVAVTRARQALYVFGNRDYVRTHSSPARPLGALLAYIESVQRNHSTT